MVWDGAWGGGYGSLGEKRRQQGVCLEQRTMGDSPRNRLPPPEHPSLALVQVKGDREEAGEPPRRELGGSGDPTLLCDYPLYIRWRGVVNVTQVSALAAESDWLWCWYQWCWYRWCWYRWPQPCNLLPCALQPPQPSTSPASSAQQLQLQLHLLQLHFVWIGLILQKRGSSEGWAG